MDDLGRLDRSAQALRDVIAVVDALRANEKLDTTVLHASRLEAAIDRARAVLALAERQLVLSVTVTRPGPAKRRTAALRVLVDVADEAYEEEFIVSWELVKQRAEQVLSGKRNLGGDAI